MDVKPDGEVFSSPLSQRGSAIFLLQADQDLVFRLRHVKHELQPRKKQFWSKWSGQSQELWGSKEMEGDLRVLQKGPPVVDAATGSVEQRLGVVVPGAPNHHLLPRLVDAQV